MNRVFAKAINIFFGLFIFTEAVFALSSEYKNSLDKVELTKTKDGSYSVNLYTQKSFNEPVKIIKKNDLSYYILLPETKNSASVISSQKEDIKDVSASMYSYAGADVKNGYTKININTTKPLNFSLAVKTTSQPTRQAAASKVASAPQVQKETTKQPQKEIIQEDKSQKKNLVSKEIKNLIPKVSVNSTTKKYQQQKNIPQTQQKQLQPKKVEKTLAQKNTQKPSQKITQKPIQKPVQKEIVTPKKVEESIKEVAQEPLQEPVQQEIQDVEQRLEQDIAQNEQQEETFENQSFEQDTSFVGNEENSVSAFFSKAKEKLSYYKNKLEESLYFYGLELKDLVIMFFAAIVTFIIMIFFLTRKSNSEPKLKLKSDLVSKQDKTPLKRKNNGGQSKTNSGQYFVFDNNVKQTGFISPATSSTHRNYELSSYDPDIRNYKTVSKKDYHPDSEYDIIQKILKEDSFIDYSQDEINFNQNKVAFDNITTPDFQDNFEEKPKPQIKAQQQVQQKEEIKEPVVLSSVEIAPERGFMCVSYNNSINLVGYIFDDVFALYNFKLPKLENYEIKYRLTAKDDKSASFIVKVMNTKFYVTVTNKSMKLEVVI